MQQFLKFIFWNRTLHVSDRFSVHHQEFSTVYAVIGICHTGYGDCLLEGSEWNILIPLASSQHNWDNGCTNRFQCYVIFT
jgi:hypothetical protein